MNKRGLCTWNLGFVLLWGWAAGPMHAAAQDRHHVVSLDELNQAAARPAQSRQANQDAVRELLSTDAGQQALRTAKVDFQRVDKAIGQLSDEDLAKVAQRSRQAESDFAAGGFKSTLIIAIVLIVILIVVLSVVF
jgi:hypothetical protein